MEKSLAAVLKAANTGLKAAAAGKEEARGLGDALRAGAENAPGSVAPHSAAASGRGSRQSTGGQRWR